MQDKQYTIEIATLSQLEVFLAASNSLNGVVLSGIDLRDPEIEAALLELRADGALFFGCGLSSRLSEHLKATGGMMFPVFEELPFDPYRLELYSVNELMSGYVRGQPETITETLDARIFAYFKERHKPGDETPILETLACRLHDHAIDRALRDLLFPVGRDDLNVVGIMGGHKLRRDQPGFLKVARIARELTLEGLFVATGGGPGAMEAGNLGAWLSERDETELVDAVEVLKPAPSYLDGNYVDLGYEVLENHPSGCASLAVPTWFYGHEPSNLFSTYIAKYFANSIREDGLLAIATYGVIFSPGSAGTVQEVFQDAAQNHYATMGVISPMVFLGVDYWTSYRPAYPLLKALSKGLVYDGMVAVTDDPKEAVEFILSHPPTTGK